MTTITTGTQGPQIRLIVLIGIALAAIGVAAMIAVNRPTTTTQEAQDASSESQAITNSGATDRVGALPDSIADAQDRAMAQDRIVDREAAALAYGGPVADAVLGDTTGATDRVAPLPDSLADAQDRAMAQVRIDDREAAAQTYGEPVADAVPGTTAGATDRVAPLPDSLADAQDRAMAQVRIDDREAAAPSPEVSTAVNPADIKYFQYFNGSNAGTSDEPVRWDDNPADIKFLNGYLDESSRADPVQDWAWPMPNEQIL